MPPTSPTRRRVRLVLLIVLGVGLSIGPAMTRPAWAQPSPAPVPAPGVPSPTPTPAPGVPSPIPTPPPGGPTPSVPSSPPAPAPSPVPSPSPAPSNDGGDGEPGMFDIPGQIRKAITEFLLWVAKTGLQPVMDTLGTTALSTPDLTGNPHVKAVWTTSLVIANGVYVLFVVLGAFIVASRETVQTRYGFKQIAPRLAVGAIVSNVSLILVGKAIEASNAITAAIAGQGVDGPRAAEAILGVLDQPLTGASPNILLALLVIAVIALGVVVVITFVMRVALLVLLFGIAPLAMVCHASPQTEGIAYTWWRALAACLGLQIAQAVVVLGTVKVFLTPSGLVLLGVPATASGLIGVLVCITMLWLLIKLPGLMKQFVLAPIGMQQQGRGLIGQLLQAFVMVKTLGAAAGLTGAAKTGTRAARARPAARQQAATSTAPRARSARAVPMPRGRAARPAVPPSVPSRPSRAAPVAFSNAPLAQTPLSAAAGTTGAPTFSHPPQAHTPTPAPTGPAPAAAFSHPSPAQPPSPRPSASPAPAAFSSTTPAPATPTLAGPAPTAMFSTTPAPQSAPRRPPAPLTPVFSSPPPTGRTRPTAAHRSTTASRASRTASPPPASAPPPPPSAPAARRTPRPAPATALPAPPPSRPRPAGSTSAMFRPAPPSPPSAAPSPPSPPQATPSPPPVRRRRQGGN